MINQLQTLTEEQRTHVESLARELDAYGLGVFWPHFHSDDSTSELPHGLVSVEVDRKVTFVPKHAVPAATVPVGWRWTPEGLQACAECCKDTDS